MINVDWGEKLIKIDSLERIILFEKRKEEISWSK
jgi:hypothetical protein